MFDAVYRIALFVLALCIAYLFGKKNTYDKGYDKGYSRGYMAGYDEGKTNTLKEIHEINKREIRK